AIIVSASILLAQRRILAAAYLYGIAATFLAATGDERFRAIPFVLLALFAATWCVSGEWRAPRARGSAWPRAGPHLGLGTMVAGGARIAMAVMLCWLLI